MECLDSYILLTVWGFLLHSMKLDRATNNVHITLCKEDIYISFIRTNGILIFKTTTDRSKFLEYEKRKSCITTNRGEDSSK